MRWRTHRDKELVLVLDFPLNTPRSVRNNGAVLHAVVGYCCTTFPQTNIMFPRYLSSVQLGANVTVLFGADIGTGYPER